MYRQDGRVFLATICTRDGRNVFSAIGFGETCLGLLRELRAARGNPVFAYCLMPDHAHLVVGVHQDCPLPSFVQAWKSLCAKAWRELGGGRSFWQRSFHDRALRRWDHLQSACLYVLANPVRRGLVGDWREYPLCGSLEWEL
ncbi:MAG: REP-associated tyrosine transposase [Thermoanaerobaculia bacterium]